MSGSVSIRLFWFFFLASLLCAATLPTLARGQEPSTPAEAEPQATAPVAKGQRMVTCAHSFHFFVPLILPDVAKKAGIEGHEQVGMSTIGGSRIEQHWNVPDDKSEAKKALRAGEADVLTLSPIYLPDDGIENFVRLALEHNPDARIFVQELWLPYDVYDTATPLRNREVRPNAATGESLRKEHAPYFKSIDEHVVALNEKLGRKDRPAVFVAPVGQAVIALREKILAGEAPGIEKQSQLFTDPIGHPQIPIQIVATYVHLAAIYGHNPIGDPTPDFLENRKDGDKLARLLQGLAWEAVTEHPLSGVTAEAGQTATP